MNLPQHDSRKRATPWLFCSLLVLIAYFGISVIQTFYQSYQNKDRMVALQQDVHQLQQQYVALQKEARSKQSSQFLESEARNKLNLAKPDEVVVIFPETKGVLGTATVTTATQPPVGWQLSYELAAWLKLFW